MSPCSDAWCLLYLAHKESQIVHVKDTPYGREWYSSTDASSLRGADSERGALLIDDAQPGGMFSVRQPEI